jgi:hypothetical protein
MFAFETMVLVFLDKLGLASEALQGCFYDVRVGGQRVRETSFCTGRGRVWGKGWTASWTMGACC